MAHTISIVQARNTKMKSIVYLDEDNEHLEEAIVLNAFKIEVDTDSIHSDVILLTKLKMALKSFNL